MAFTWTAEDGFDPMPASNGNNYIPYALSADGQLIAGILDATDSTVFRCKESTGLIDAGVFPGALWAKASKKHG